MPNYLEKIVYLTDAQYSTLVANPNATIGGHQFDPHALYITNTAGNAGTVNGHTVEANVPSNAVFTDTHRSIQVNNTQILGNNTTALNLKAGNNVTITATENSSDITISVDGVSAADEKVRQVATSSSFKKWRKILVGYSYGDTADFSLPSTEPVEQVYQVHSIAINPDDGALKATEFLGNLTGNVTGNVSGTAGSVAWANVTNHPTNVSAFTNDAGYLTSFTETDPTVPAWAKASTKPTYTANEVGALASDTVVTNVSISEDVTTNKNYPIVFGSTPSDGTLPGNEKVEGLQKNIDKLYFNPSTGNLVSTKFNGYILNDASAKAVDTSISNNSTSNNLPTSQAVANFIEGKGYQTALSFDGTYNANSNKVATVSTVTDAISGISFPVTSVAGLSGGDIQASDLRSALNLSQALRFVGVTTTNMAGNTSSQNSWTGTPAGLSSYTPQVGDVVINSTKKDEWVCISATETTYVWERLGSDTSYKLVQNQITTATAETTAATTFVYSVTQNENGEITVKTRPLNTSGDWNGNANTATTATNLASAPVFANGSNNTITLTVGGQTSSPYTVPYASKTSAANLVTSANSIAYFTNATGTFESKASANGALYSTDDGAALQWGTLPIAQGGTGVTSFTDNNAVVMTNNNSTALITREVTNNTTDTAIVGSTNFPTMNTIYHGLVQVNNASQTRATTIYAPTSGGTAGLPLIGNGATSAPIWYEGVSLEGSAAASWVASFLGTSASTTTNSGAVTIAGGLGVAEQVTALRLAANGSNTSYSLYINGVSYFNGNTTHNGIDYFANGTTYYIDNDACGYLSDLRVDQVRLNGTLLGFYSSNNAAGSLLGSIEGILDNMHFVIDNGTANTTPTFDFNGHILPSTNQVGALGSSTKRWSALYLGTNDTYGDEYTPIYWNSGLPATTSPLQYQAFTIASGNYGVKLSHTAFTENSYVSQIVVTSGEANLSSAISWTSGTGYIDLVCTTAPSDDVTGYIIIGRGAQLQATSTAITTIASNT